MIPREILNKELPPDVAKEVRGSRGEPNVWPIPRDVHKEIYRGAGGGRYNERWRQEIDQVRQETGGEPTVEDVRRIREKLINEFGLGVYSP